MQHNFVPLRELAEGLQDVRLSVYGFRVIWRQSKAKSVFEGEVHLKTHLIRHANAIPVPAEYVLIPHVVNQTSPDAGLHISLSLADVPGSVIAITSFKTSRLGLLDQVITPTPLTVASGKILRVALGDTHQPGYLVWLHQNIVSAWRRFSICEGDDGTQMAQGADELKGV